MFVPSNTNNKSWMLPKQQRMSQSHTFCWNDCTGCAAVRFSLAVGALLKSTLPVGGGSEATKSLWGRGAGS